eukprot:UN00685
MCNIKVIGAPGGDDELKMGYIFLSTFVNELDRHESSVSSNSESSDSEVTRNKNLCYQKNCSFYVPRFKMLGYRNEKIIGRGNRLSFANR